ncbi:hypothetical protein ACFQAT_13470 [Undibacterium arcticum]|uniref:hypothetical protein n=1 Tax=Undibacterium arcticum TaxID=1762892 RepID=UPI00361E746F
MLGIDLFVRAKSPIARRRVSIDSLEQIPVSTASAMGICLVRLPVFRADQMPFDHDWRDRRDRWTEELRHLCFDLTATDSLEVLVSG